MKKTVLYIGNFSFPFGNASGKRVYANGKILSDLGYNVIFIGMDQNISNKMNLIKTKKIFDNFTYYNFSYPQGNLEWLNYIAVFNEIKSLLEKENILKDVEIVINYGSLRISLLNWKLNNYFKEHGVKVVVDVVDWLTVKTKNPIFDLVKWADNTFKRSFINKHVDGIIAISNFLSDYYTKNGCKTLILPPLSSNKNIIFEPNIKNSNKKIITYAGLPFRKGQPIQDYNKLKDRIDKTVFLFNKLKKDGIDFIFNIYGFTKEEYLIAIPVHKQIIEELGVSVIFHGHKPNNEVVDSVSKSDFTILLRDINRDTTAGFPTKISESISYGTPVITTNTSDLSKYIVEGKSGFFINIKDMDKAVSKLKLILMKDKEEILSMKYFCQNNNPFFYTNFIKSTSDFIKEIIN